MVVWTTKDVSDCTFYTTYNVLFVQFAFSGDRWILDIWNKRKMKKKKKHFVSRNYACPAPEFMLPKHCVLVGIMWSVCKSIVWPMCRHCRYIFIIHSIYPLYELMALNHTEINQKNLLWKSVSALCGGQCQLLLLCDVCGALGSVDIGAFLLLVLIHDWCCYIVE